MSAVAPDDYIYLTHLGPTRTLGEEEDMHIAGLTMRPGGEIRVRATEVVTAVIGVEPALFLAVQDAESQGKGFLPGPDGSHTGTGEMRLSFDTSAFNRSEPWHEVFREKYGHFPTIEPRGQDDIRRARLIHMEHADNCTRMGICQIQGWNAYRMGYRTAPAMRRAWAASLPEQIKAMAVFFQFANPAWPLLDGGHAPATSVGPILVAARRAQRSGELAPFCEILRPGNRDYKERTEAAFADWRETLALRKGYQGRGRSRGLRGDHINTGLRDIVNRDMRWCSLEDCLRSPRNEAAGAVWEATHRLLKAWNSL